MASGGSGGALARGALIVLEGCDKTGKTTQCKKLLQALKCDDEKVAVMHFPDRTTTIGKVIDEYLRGSKELDDHAIHLLFSANRWELVPQMMKLLSSGTTVIVDRYSFSGVAYSSAKKSIDMQWACQPEIGLPKPDAVLFMELSQEAAAARGGYGMERYEKHDFQLKVLQNYMKLQDETWQMVNAEKLAEKLHEDLLVATREIMAKVKHTPLATLWKDGLPSGV